MATAVGLAVAEDGLAVEGWLVVDMGAGDLGGAESVGHGSLGGGGSWHRALWDLLLRHLFMKKHVLCQGGFVQESLVTESAGVSHTLGHGNVGLDVLLEIGGCCESLSAFSTLEGLFTSVDLLVSLEVGDLKR